MRESLESTRRSHERAENMENCLFCKIAGGQIPARKVHEDDEILAFHDINPARPVHLLVIPRRHITSLATATEADVPVLGRMLAIANRLASEQGSPDGFRVIINTGRIGHQEVQHLHAHVVGGPEPVGPMLKRI
ncbi:MAG: HIT-like protein [Candidatus Accumulibacter vicinus]|uniref:HIT-like protein n=2 Tax=Candidatus Accumulibacter vicinus TaxID=2954382 RepID=A0A084XZT4_9PROT|nr:MAG: HIT-like protein [Candidatus Accumulibacter vicinus]